MHNAFLDWTKLVKAVRYPFQQFYIHPFTHFFVERRTFRKIQLILVFLVDLKFYQHFNSNIQKYPQLS